MEPETLGPRRGRLRATFATCRPGAQGTQGFDVRQPLKRACGDLNFPERDTGPLEQQAGEPSKRRSLVEFRIGAPEQLANFQGIGKRHGREVRRNGSYLDQVAGGEGSLKAGVGRALAGHERMFAYPVLRPRSRRESLKA